MQIEGLPPALAQALLTVIGRGGEGFRPAPAGEGPEAPGQATPAQRMPGQIGPGVANATSVEMLVALATLDPASERRRRITASADRGLALLEELHAALAAGVTAPEPLQALADWAARGREPTRARVEAGASRESLVARTGGTAGGMTGGTAGGTAERALASLLDEIELRVAVELAKHEVRL